MRGRERVRHEDRLALVALREQRLHAQHRLFGRESPVAKPSAVGSIRVALASEVGGVDLSEHGEHAYDDGDSSPLHGVGTNAYLWYKVIAQLPMDTGGDTLVMEFDRQVP